MQADSKVVSGHPGVSEVPKDRDEQLILTLDHQTKSREVALPAPGGETDPAR